MNDLFSLRGRFAGRGMNHEGQSFTGVFEVKPEGHRLSLSFTATGDDGTSFHTESSLIGRSLSGPPALWVLSSNHPGVFERPLKRSSSADGRSVYVFGFGEVEDRATFREEILLEIDPASVRYVYSWGLPGGDFAERSGCRMQRAD